MKRNKEREQRPLLMQQAPILSDEMPSSANNTKKKGWRKRLFGKQNQRREGPKSPQYEGPTAGVVLVSSSSSSSRSRSSQAPSPPPKATAIVTVTAAAASQKDDATESTNNTSINTSTNTSEEQLAQLEPQENKKPLTPVMEPPSTPASSPEPPASYSTKSTSTPNRGAVERLLSRPFGRDKLLAREYTWIVQVAQSEWETEESLWKYRIDVQKRQTQENNNGSIIDYNHTTNGSTFRSLPDFYWLEQALITEFHGGLLLPSLSISLGIPSICEHEVDSKLLANWLSDILNGIRGQGELLLNSSIQKVDLMSCESMEAFFYRTDLLQILELPKTPTNLQPEPPGSPGANSTTWKWMYPEICAGGGCGPETTMPLSTPPKPQNLKKVLDKVNCSSGALGDARSFNVQQDSFVEAPTFDATSSLLAKHSDLLQAEKELVWSWRTHSLVAMEKLRLLQEQEKQIGAAWKRFAISVSNLFAYEKDVESARLGDSKSRSQLQIPYRKLQKSAVDDCLRILARQKVERSTPGLERLGVMLSAYVADLSAVQPSVQAYLEGLSQLAKQKQTCELLKLTTTTTRPNSRTNSTKQPSTIAYQIQASLIQVKKQLVEGADNNPDIPNHHGDGQEQQRLQTMEHRVLVNEALLKDFLTTLCKTTPVRTARMAYSYFRMETKQCNLMHGAAVQTRSKICVASKESLSKMIHRHQLEVKEDRITELSLVRRIVNIIGNTKKFLTDDGSITEEVERGVEINKDVENEAAKLRDNALNLCRERIGRWDAKLAMAMMEAVGVSDANVRVEETTRDLRMVRKYAIGLRENLLRCVEGLESLKMSILQGGYGDIRDLRQDFMTEVQNLCSATYLGDGKPILKTSALKAAGIHLNDRAGWLRADGFGGVVKSYTDTRESGTEWLLDSLGELLKEYNQRVEAVESFVYMECVGIQLEKHFSQARTSTLAAFEKKTDITSAINIATRKRMPVLVKELNTKLEAVGADVSHTTVKEAKEAHLESKTLKQELHTLAMRRLTRSRETSTERVIALMTVWSKEEETAASSELKLLKGLLQSLEMSMGKEELEAYKEASPAPR